MSVDISGPIFTLKKFPTYASFKNQYHLSCFGTCFQAKACKSLSFECSFRTATDPVFNRAEDVVAHTGDHKEVTVECKCRPMLIFAHLHRESNQQNKQHWCLPSFTSLLPLLVWPGLKPHSGLAEASHCEPEHVVLLTLALGSQVDH